MVKKTKSNTVTNCGPFIAWNETKFYVDCEIRKRKS